MDVVYRQQMAEIVMTLNSIKICSGEIAASLAFTVGFNSSKIFAILFVAKFDLTLRSECSSKSGCPCRIHAIEHINPKSHTECKIDWVAHSH
jgi:hypothetical protein